MSSRIRFRIMSPQIVISSFWMVLLVYLEFLDEVRKCLCSTLSPPQALNFSSSRKLPWFACGLFSSCFLSSRWPRSGMPCLPQVMMVSTMEHNFSLFSLTCRTRADWSWWVIGWVWPDIVSVKLLASSTASAWYFALPKWSLSFVVAFFQLIKGQLTKAP